MEKSRIYTKSGDNGTTSLVGGKRVSKASLQLEAYGTADELNSLLGLLSAQLPADSPISPILQRIQHHLFHVGGYLACEPDSPYYEKGCIVSDEQISFLELTIDRFDAELPKIRSFILPAGSVATAQAHVCRTVCRRLERRVIALQNEQQVDERVLVYLNRLSDLLFVLSRWLRQLEGKMDVFWDKGCM